MTRTSRLVGACVLRRFRLVWLFGTPWTVAPQAPLSMEVLQARVLEWVAMPSSRGSSWPRDQTSISCLAGGFFTTDSPGKASLPNTSLQKWGQYNKKKLLALKSLMKWRVDTLERKDVTHSSHVSCSGRKFFTTIDTWEAYYEAFYCCHFSHVRLCATPSLGFSRREHWSGLPFPSPMQESEKWKQSSSAMSESSRPHGLQPTRLLHPWEFPGKSTGVGCHCLLQISIRE